MTLRMRLVAAFTILLLIVIAAVGFVVVRSSRQVLTNQVDEALIELQNRVADPRARPPVGEPFRQEDDPTERGIAYVNVDSGGVVVFADPSGYIDDPDPLPDPASYAAVAADGGIVTVASTDGSLQYRAFADVTDLGGIEVWAAPLEEVDAAVDDIIRALLLAGLGVGVLGGAVTWLMMQRGLQPVDRMVDTATAIAAGDLSHRVGETDTATELGRLGLALNEMLAQIEQAFSHEQAAKERLKQFVADASHELRTPIAAVKGYSELYRQGALRDPHDLDNAIRRIATETKRMERLVADLLLLARLDRGQAMEHRPVDLAAVVRDAVTDGRAIAPDRPVAVHGPDSVRVNGDEQRLTQVVANLLSNTRMHTPAGTPVTVTLRNDNGHVALDVVDDGPGLPAEAERLFDRFYRIDNSRARNSGGSGLGLAIVAAIVAAHGGTVEAANQEGHGARFTITLPGADRARSGEHEADRAVGGM